MGCGLRVAKEVGSHYMRVSFAKSPPWSLPPLDDAVVWLNCEVLSSAAKDCVIEGREALSGDDVRPR